MKTIGITQRVESNKNYLEKRDSLDQNWYSFCNKLNFLSFPLPNINKNINNHLKNYKLSAILLSGGNDISYVDKNKNSSIERDYFETQVIKFAIKNKIPLIGVCRGMQMLNLYFGGKLNIISNHINKTHKIKFDKKKVALPKLVNSYHRWGIKKNNLANIFLPLAYDQEGNIEAFFNKEKKILGIMWHPERDKPFNKLNIHLFNKFLK